MAEACAYDLHLYHGCILPASFGSSGNFDASGQNAHQFVMIEGKSSFPCFGSKTFFVLWVVHLFASIELGFEGGFLCMAKFP